jgi:hypothetical protein
LRDAACKVRVLSRRRREAGEDIEFVTGDLATGERIEAAVEGAEIILAPDRAVGRRTWEDFIAERLS